MAKIILNKNTATEYVLDVVTLTEDTTIPVLSGIKGYPIDEEHAAPDIKPLITDSVETVEAITDDGLMIPIVGAYNKVANLTVDYNDNPDRYTVRITIISEAE